MIATANGKQRFRTFADVLTRLGDVPTNRVLTHPAPGTATVEDLLDPVIRRGGAVELIDGTCVVKAMGAREVGLALWLAVQLFNFARIDNLGMVFGSQAPIRLNRSVVRLPDVSFIRWDSVENPADIENPPGAILEVIPSLIVEVLSPSDTPREMQIKLQEYAQAKVQLVWYVDPIAQTVTVYPRGKERGKRLLTVDDTLDGGKVLPGFALPVKELFASRAPSTHKRKPT